MDFLPLELMPGFFVLINNYKYYQQMHQLFMFESQVISARKPVELILQLEQHSKYLQFFTEHLLHVPEQFQVQDFLIILLKIICHQPIIRIKFSLFG
jgi:hypothetical protein